MSSPTRSLGLTATLTTPAGVVHFARRGTGSPILLLHDLGADHRSFAGLASLLTGRHHVVAMDLLGHGASERAADLSVPAQTTAALHLLRDLQIDDVILIGHSLGGAVALELAREAPGAVRKVVLLAAGCYSFTLPLAWRLARRRIVWRLLGRFAMDRAVRSVGSLTRGKADAAALPPLHGSTSSRAGWAALGRALRQVTSEESLSELEIVADLDPVHPTLVIWGAEDRLIPAAAARLAFRGKRNVRFVEIAGGSHAVHEEEPGVVGDLILEFLE